jgi:hypothetical protein
MATAVSHTTHERAQALLARAPFWPKAYDRNGVLIGYSFRSSRTLPDGTPVYHLTLISPPSCSCEGYKHRSMCCHSVAVSEYEARHQRTVEAARKRYADLFAPDDDKPYCAPCRRHHDQGQHYPEGLCGALGCENVREISEDYCPSHVLCQAF